MIPRFLSVTDVCLVHLRKTELFTTVMPSKIFEAAGTKRPIIIGVSGFATDFVLRAEAGLGIEPDAVLGSIAELTGWWQENIKP